MILLLAIVFALAFLITLNAVPRIMRMAWKRNFLDHPGPRKVHREPVPYGGGVAVAAGVLIPVLGGIAAALAHVHLGMSVTQNVEDIIPGIVNQSPRLALLIAASFCILLLGLVDDRRGLNAWTKLAVQTGIAIVMAFGYERLDLFAGEMAGWKIVSGVVTVVWIVGVTNAFNLLDHMDGLCAGVALVAGACFFGVAVLTGQWYIAMFLAAMLGACIAFLIFNFPPAKVFLGDAGSLFIGFMLASLTISFTFYHEMYPLYSYAVPILVLSVPLFDTSSVVWIRLREGRSPFDADTNHFAHRLVNLGLGRRAAVLTIYALTMVTGISAALLYKVDILGALMILGQVVVVFAIITILEVRGRRKANAEKDE